MKTTLRIVDGIKGGSGKSTVALAMADYYASKGHVLVVDADKATPDDSQQLNKLKYLR